MGLFGKLKKLHKKMDPVGTKIAGKTKKALGVSSKKSSGSKTAASTPAASQRASGGSSISVGGNSYSTGSLGTLGTPMKGVSGSSAMNTARGISAGAKSGVGRLQKQRLK